MTAVITAQGENIMNAEQTETAPASVAAEPKATKTARVAKRGAHVAPKKAKSAKKATPAKKAPKAKKATKAREGSKTDQILEGACREGERDLDHYVTEGGGKSK